MEIKGDTSCLNLGFYFHNMQHICGARLRARRERGDSPTPSQGTTPGVQLLGISASPGPAKEDGFGKVFGCLEIEVGAVEVSVVAFSKITLFFCGHLCLICVFRCLVHTFKSYF